MESFTSNAIELITEAIEKWYKQERGLKQIELQRFNNRRSKRV